MQKLWVVMCGMLAGLLLQQAAAADLSVLSAGAIEPGVNKAVVAFQQETGHKVRLQFNTAPQIRKRLTEGEAWDVVIAPPALLDELGRSRKPGAERVAVGRVGLGVVVRMDAPVPDIASTEALKQALLQSESLVFNRASTGIYLEGLLLKMGLWPVLEGRTTRYPDGASVMEHVLHGKGREIGFGAMTEILLYREKGLKLVGPLPAEVQNYTSYSGTVIEGAKEPKVASEFVRYLGGPVGRGLFAAAGIEP
jgi:molybdate transport system substrate-binding protein